MWVTESVFLLESKMEGWEESVLAQWWVPRASASTGTQGDPQHCPLHLEHHACDALRRSLCGFLSLNSPAHCTHEKDWIYRTSYKLPGLNTALRKMVKVIKSKESQRNCHSQGEPKETWQLRLHGLLGKILGRRRDHSHKIRDLHELWTLHLPHKMAIHMQANLWSWESWSRYLVSR